MSEDKSYRYYCVDCANSSDDMGEDYISFDLNEFLEIRHDVMDIMANDTKHFRARQRMAHASNRKLLEYVDSEYRDAVNSGKPGGWQEVRFDIKLSDYLQLIGANIGKNLDIGEGKFRSLMEQIKTIDELKHGKADMDSASETEVGRDTDSDTYTADNNETVKDMGIESNQNPLNEIWKDAAEDTEEKVERFADILLERFSYVDSGETGTKDAAASEKLLSNYHAYFWGEIEYLSDGKIYTVRYKRKENDSDYIDPMYGKAQGVVRGYCPKCGAPVLRETGRCEHVLVGMLGTQSAGKTCLILSMLSQLPLLCSKLNVKTMDSDSLTDSKTDETQIRLNQFKAGWAPEKTDRGGGNLFSVSVDVKSKWQDDKGRDVKKIVTLVDIPGELIYDQYQHRIHADTKKDKRFRLIYHCSMYLLCSCVNEDVLLRSRLPLGAATTIAAGILNEYRANRRNKGTPPICIVFTQYDALQKQDGSGSTDAASDNPYEDMVESELYQYKSHIDDIALTYKSLYGNDSKAFEELSKCAEFYEQNLKDTYFSFLHNAALGREADKLTENELFKSNGRELELNQSGKFEPKNIDELWDWILTVAGVKLTASGTLLGTVPNRELDNNDLENLDLKNTDDYQDMQRYCEGLASVFLNPLKVPEIPETSEEKPGLLGTIKNFFSRRWND